MAVFSNFEGTMKTKFILGKNGASINYANNSLSITDSFGSILLPVQVGEPINDDSAVTPKYLAEHPTVLFGNDIPDNSIGEENYTYFQLDPDSGGILDIFAKKNGIWIKSMYINTKVLSSTNGSDYIGLVSGGTLQQALYYVTPEEFGAIGDGIADDTVAVQECADYAKEHDIQIQGKGIYRLSKAIYFENIEWYGGTLTGTGKTMISVTNSKVQGANIARSYIQFSGGDGKFYFNRFYGTTFTCAFFMRDLTSEGIVDFCFNEMFDVNFGVLQQGGSGEVIRYARYAYNHIHDIYGDGIELNVVSRHFTDGLIIEGNHIENVDGTKAPIPLSNWGIGIGIAGKGPYGVDIPDSQYVKNFTIARNRIYNCRQCIHVEVCKNFNILDNETYPSTTISTGTGLTAAGFIAYGCQNFIIDGLTGRYLDDPATAPTNRMIKLTWGVNPADSTHQYPWYAGPPKDFKIQNTFIPESSIEIYTACSDSWTNETDLHNITCEKLFWRGLPSSSKFSKIYTKNLDVIGQYQDGEGGGVYNRSRYIYTNWIGNIVQDEANVSNYSFSRMYVDRIDQSGNNFTVTTEIDGTGHRGPVLIPVTEQYYLPYDEFPGGRYFPKGTILHKQTGGKYVVTEAGAFVGKYEQLKAAAVGAKTIRTNNTQWGTNQYAKAAGTRIVIPGAGENGTDLHTHITRATYVVNAIFCIDIADEIKTAFPDGTPLLAETPITYITLP